MAASAAWAAEDGAVDRALAASASAFESFTRKASDIDPAFKGAPQVRAGLQAGAAYEPRELEAGMVAYGAVAALQEEAFADGLRRAGPRMARQIAYDPEAVLELPGAEAAAGRANAALRHRGEALSEAGEKVKKAAYTVQRQGWSKVRISGAARLSEVKRAGTAGYKPAQGDTARLFTAVSDGGRRGGMSPIATRATAVAALKALGDERGAQALMADTGSGFCLRMAKLNYHQCLASAGTHYEDIFCLGTHAMMETGRCVADATRAGRSRRAGL